MKKIVGAPGTLWVLQLTLWVLQHPQRDTKLHPWYLGGGHEAAMASPFRSQWLPPSRIIFVWQTDRLLNLTGPSEKSYLWKNDPNELVGLSSSVVRDASPVWPGVAPFWPVAAPSDQEGRPLADDGASVARDDAPGQERRPLPLASDGGHLEKNGTPG